jgi:hypothetical protein
MIPYVVDPAWFERHWYGRKPKAPEQRASLVSAAMMLLCSAVLAGFTLSGGFGPIGG